MVADFHAGDTRRRDRAWLPGDAELLREEAERFPAEADHYLAQAREVDRYLREIDGRALPVV